MVYALDGTPLQGITGGYGGDRRVDHIIPRSAVAAGSYDVIIESSCNGMFGVGMEGDVAPPDPNRYFTLNSADLVVPNQEAWGLLWDYTTLRGTKVQSTRMELILAQRYRIIFQGILLLKMKL